MQLNQIKFFLYIVFGRSKKHRRDFFFHSTKDVTITAANYKSLTENDYLSEWIALDVYLVIWYKLKFIAWGLHIYKFMFLRRYIML